MRGLVSVLALLLAAATAAAAPRSIEECEAIQAPHAYNECLAAFGPTRGGGGNYTAPAAGPEGGGAHRMMRQRPARLGAYLGARTGRVSSGPGLSHMKNGRVRMEFTPGRR